MTDLKKISNSESDIMNVIWESDQVLCVNDILVLLDNIQWKYTTVVTFLTRHCQKGFLQCEKIGKQNFYRATISRSEYLNTQVEDFVKEVYCGSTTGFIAALAKDKISETDYAELLDILRKYED